MEKGEQMNATAIFFGAMLIAKSIDASVVASGANMLLCLLLMFLIADILKLIKEKK